MSTCFTKIFIISCNQKYLIYFYRIIFIDNFKFGTIIRIKLLLFLSIIHHFLYYIIFFAIPFFISLNERVR